MNQLHSKSYTVTQYLARYFLSIDEKARILTVSEFLKEIDVARGTIQNGLQVLKDAHAINLSSRGKLGTFLEKKNINLLLQFADIRSIVGVMPLPYTRLYEGLSTGIIESMSKKIRLPLNMAYMRGAQKRIELVSEGRYDFAVVSRFAAQQYLKDHPESIKMVVHFGAKTYLKGHVLLFKDHSKSTIEPKMRIAIDYDSIDQTKITVQECAGIDVVLVPMTYSQFASSLSSGKVDAVIWNEDELTGSLNTFKKAPIHSEIDGNTEAVIVVDANRSETIKLIEEGLDTKGVLAIQHDIVTGTRTPQY